MMVRNDVRSVPELRGWFALGPAVALGLVVAMITDSSLAAVHSYSGDEQATPTMGSFSASLFKFKTTIPDDGTGKGGGEQQASATLTFVDARHDPPPAWICNVTIRMPLRTATHGSVSALQASQISAKVTTAASRAVMRSRPAWQPTLFCKEFQDKMNDVFFYDHAGLGARATATR